MRPWYRIVSYRIEKKTLISYRFRIGSKKSLSLFIGPGTRRCSTRWPRRTSTLSSIGSSKGGTVTLHGATRRTGSPSSRRPRSPKRSTTMLNHTWIKGRFTVALKTKLNSKTKKYFRCFQAAAAAAVKLFSLWLITIHSDSNKIYNRISMPQNYFSPSDNLVR